METLPVVSWIETKNNGHGQSLLVLIKMNFNLDCRLDKKSFPLSKSNFKFGNSAFPTLNTDKKNNCGLIFNSSITKSTLECGAAAPERQRCRC